MSEREIPASRTALSAASACSCTWDMFGMTPSCVVSAAPTTAALDRFMSRLQTFKERKRDLLLLLGKSDLERHVSAECFPHLGAARYVRHHSGAFFALHSLDRRGSLDSTDHSLSNDD